MLVGLTNKTNWQQTNREHRYKYIGDNGGRWMTSGGGWRQAQRQMKLDQGVTDVIDSSLIFPSVPYQAGKQLSTPAEMSSE